MRWSWLALALLTAVACRPPTTGPVRLARGVDFTLRPAGEGPTFFASQEVVCHLPSGAEETVLTAVESDARGLALVVSSPLGMTLFTVRCQDGTTQVDARVPLPRLLDPRLLPALVQLANWPVEALRLGLGSATELTEEGSMRTLSHAGKPILTLAREGQKPPYTTVRVAVPDLGITLVISTLEATP
jgi:hypothetical protein